MSPKRLLCPTCQREIQWSSEFPYRPFCSERCRLIDLGAWLTEKHAIPDIDAHGSDDPGTMPDDGRSEPQPPS